MTLTRQILLAMLAAILFGSLTQFLLQLPGLPVLIRYCLHDLLVAGLFELGGRVFLTSLTLLVVPLVLVSLIVGVSQLQDSRALGRMGLKTLLLYLITTALAISLALLLASLLQPGAGVHLDAPAGYSAPPAKPFLDVLADIIPGNPVAAMAQGNMLQIIVFALLVGFAIGRSGEAGQRLAAHFRDWDAVLMTLVSLLMKLAPYGVFCLLFTVFARQGLGTAGDLLLYMATVLMALLLHALVVYPLLLKGLTGLSPRPFLRKMRTVQMFAFSTATSNATIPVNLRNAEQRLGVDNRIAAFVIPLGATINMDGTAIMQGVATVFIAQAFGLDLLFSDYLLIILTATLASIGTAGVPGVGLVTLAMVLQQVGLPAEGIALIIGVDRLLDMARTAVNVTGDALVAILVANGEQALNKTRYADPDAGEPAA